MHYITDVSLGSILSKDAMAVCWIYIELVQILRKLQNLVIYDLPAGKCESNPAMLVCHAWRDAPRNQAPSLCLKINGQLGLSMVDQGPMIQ